MRSHALIYVVAAVIVVPLVYAFRWLITAVSPVSLNDGVIGAASVALAFLCFAVLIVVSMRLVSRRLRVECDTGSQLTENPRGTVPPAEHQKQPPPSVPTLPRPHSA